MTQVIQQSLILTVLRQVSPDRLQRAVNVFVESEASITLTRTTDTEIRALVRHGEDREYGVTLTETSVFCSCRDALYRGQICKHATLLALRVLRTNSTTREITQTIHLVSQEGVALCGIQCPSRFWKWPYWPEMKWKESCADCEKIRRQPVPVKSLTVAK
jgi:hypothetical protein